ncbi:MAG: cyclic nucleotide-binding domain-containing protein [Thermosynechococcaceae cyanobacterium MS004]|nr:cyclic nucleotide-binding domain-containing protein [Thermosynechococcaceae cyanobacterium MS004]
MRNVLIALGALSDSDIDWVLAVGSKVKVAKGKPLVRMGQPIDALYLLLEGQFGVSVSQPSVGPSIEQPVGQPIDYQIVAQLTAGDIVGEMSIVDSQMPSANVTALQESWVLSIPRSQLKRHLSTDLGFAARFYRMVALFLSSRLRVLNAQAAGSRLSSLEAGIYDADEIAPDVLDDLALAASRFEWILHRLDIK